VPVGKNVVGLPLVPPAAIVVLQETIKTLGVLRSINEVFDPPVIVTR